MNVPLQYTNYENQSPLKIGAIQSEPSEAEYKKHLHAHHEALWEELSPNFKVQIANGKLVPIPKRVLQRFCIALKVFEEIF